MSRCGPGMWLLQNKHLQEVDKGESPTPEIFTPPYFDAIFCENLRKFMTT